MYNNSAKGIFLLIFNFYLKGNMAREYDVNQNRNMHTKFRLELSANHCLDMEVNNG